MTRRELIVALRGRYAEADRKSKRTILDEFVEVSGYHRKHAIRLLGSKSRIRKKEPQRAGRLYGEAVLQALILLWEAADRICGKRKGAVAGPDRSYGTARTPAVGCRSAVAATDGQRRHYRSVAQ